MPKYFYKKTYFLKKIIITTFFTKKPKPEHFSHKSLFSGFFIYYMALLENGHL